MMVDVRYAITQWTFSTKYVVFTHMHQFKIVLQFKCMNTKVTDNVAFDTLILIPYYSASIVICYIETDILVIGIQLRFDYDTRILTTLTVINVKLCEVISTLFVTLCACSSYYIK